MKILNDLGKSLALDNFELICINYSSYFSKSYVERKNFKKSNKK